MLEVETSISSFSPKIFLTQGIFGACFMSLHIILLL